MNLTEEQKAIIASSGDIKINAVAGSGKTTTVIEFARSRPGNARILYLAFNKSVKMEAARKFAEQGITNVQVETAHSLAFRHIVYRSNYKVKSQGYKTSEIAELLNLQPGSEQHAEYIVANHINKYLTYFCNSNKEKVQELNYLDAVTDEKARNFVKQFYNEIQSQTRLLLAKMDRCQIEISHDFYLKKFQLASPELPFDYILFDEGQDASPAMLDIFLKQKAIKLIVGDTHQQIYGWRYAVNSLEQTKFPSFDLSTSFRFHQDIANLAMEVLKMKTIIGGSSTAKLFGKGSTQSTKTRATLARTNLGLLLEAINFVTGNIKDQRVYFEGNIHSYTYADEGASLYDVLNLYNYKFDYIRDKLIRQMKSLKDLEDYVEKTEDMQLGVMVNIVREYGNRIPDILKTIKERHVGDDEKEKADMIFSTVHRCKGMEYDAVKLSDDFITEERLNRLMEDKKNPPNIARLNEEINLLYVAVTRAKNLLRIPEIFIPENFPKSKFIEVLKPKPTGTETMQNQQDYKSFGRNRFADRLMTNKYDRASAKMKSASANKPWTADLDEDLRRMYVEECYDIRELAEHFNRSQGAIWSRLRKLNIDD